MIFGLYIIQKNRNDKLNEGIIKTAQKGGGK